MNRRTLTAAAAGLVAAAAFGMSAQIADAAPVAKSHAHHVKVNKQARLLAIAKKTVQQEIARQDVALVRVVKDSRLRHLDATTAGTIRANATADRAGLAALKNSTSAATTVAEVRSVAAKVKLVRPEVYNLAVNAATKAAWIQTTVARNTTKIADLTAQADAKEAGGSDVTAVRTALADATASNLKAAEAATDASELAVKLTATATKADLSALGARLHTADVALYVVYKQLKAAADALAALV
jgi:hypothetical protein